MTSGNQQMLDKMVLGLFQQKGSVFLTTLYCSLKFTWTEDVSTACTNGIYLKANPTWFAELSESMRITVLAHELWHVGFMHMLRQGDRDDMRWNQATDYAINLMLVDNGYAFENDPVTGLPLGLLDEQYRGMSAEQIYDRLVQDNSPVELPFGKDFTNDGDELQEQLSDAEKMQVMNIVLKAHTMSQMNNEAGSLPGEITQLLKGLLHPKLPWESLLRRWLNERSEMGYNWRRPNRRYQDMYLPSRGGEEGLDRLLWAFDVSGSVTDQQLEVFLSELRHAKELYQPEEMHVVTFDTEIRNRWDFLRDDAIDGIEITGRGGTDLGPVFELARKLRPTAMVIFSDMRVYIPDPIPGIAVLWVCMGNPDWTPPYGEVVHV